VEFGVHLGGDYVGKGGLAESRWSSEQEVVGGLTAFTSGFQHHSQVALQFGLADEFVESTGSQSDFDVDVDRVEVG
tara:strand:+ start:570 stop:797 length:228 start_codon:yes stop_codon:yes gene_type:complete